MSKNQIIKLAQPGYDVKTAGDQNLIFNSNWPLLKITHSGSFQTRDGTTPVQPVINHGLGYAPVFMVFSNNRLTDYNSDPLIHINDTPRSELSGTLVTRVYMDTTTLRYYATDFNKLNDTSANNSQLFYYIFALDLAKQYNAPSIKVGNLTGGGVGSFKLKIAKATKDVSSTNLEDFVVHSDARSPLIHSVNPGTTAPDATAVGGYSFTIKHNLGYIPMTLLYRNSTNADGTPFNANTADLPKNSWFPYFYGTGGNEKIQVDETQFRVQSVLNNQRFSVVILKDPFNINDSIEVDI